MKKKILVIEDESIIAEDISLALKKIGCRVIGTFASAEKALSRLKKDTPDLVLADIVLNGTLNGIEAAEIIMCRYEIPVLFLTSYSDDITIKRIKATKARGYLIKPVTTNELKKALEKAFSKNDTSS